MVWARVGQSRWDPHWDEFWAHAPPPFTNDAQHDGLQLEVLPEPNTAS